VAILWIALRNGDRRFGVLVAVLSLAWSVVAVKVVVPHFSAGESSYWARYLPPGSAARYPVTQADVMSYWLNHPTQVLNDLLSEAKLSYVHRMLFPLGYLSLLNPITLAAGIPSALLVLLSYEPHMYSGVAHYSVELVPVVVVSAILGAELISKLAASRFRLSPLLTIGLCCLYVAGASLANQRVNGFSPLAQTFALPVSTAHDRLLDQVLASIPADASVSAQDQLNAHLSDRGQIYFFPDLNGNRVQYIVLDATKGTGSPIHPCDLYTLVVGERFPAPAAALPCDTAVSTVSSELPAPATPAILRAARANALLHDGRWSIRFARDGILLLERGKPQYAAESTLPASFYSFATPWAGQPDHRVVARFGDTLELDGFSIARRENTNIRIPDVVVTTWWRVLKAPTQALTLMHYVSDNTGAVQVFSSDQQATDWLPIAGWQVGHTYMVQSSQLAVKTNHSGQVGVDIGITTDPLAYSDAGKNLRINLQENGGTSALVGPCSCKMLQLTKLDAHL
jgi:hypothetical protein